MMSDKIFLKSVSYDDTLGYDNRLDRAPEETRARANMVRNIILELVLRGKLDKTDLKIIEARNHSPMPSTRKIARRVNLDHSNVIRRAHRIERLITGAIVR